VGFGSLLDDPVGRAGARRSLLAGLGWPWPAIWAGRCVAGVVGVGAAR